MGSPRLHVVDVFCVGPYTGNQLAVVSGCDGLDGAAMQRIALETNYSETTFVAGGGPGSERFDVRIFTPTVEIPFAGHPTLGTAYVIRNELGWAAGDRVLLALGVGPVPVDFEPDAKGGELVWMEPPAPSLGRALEPAQGAALLGLGVEDVDARFPVQEASVGIEFVIVPLRSAEALARCRVPEAARQRALDAGVTAFSVLAFCVEPCDAANDLGARLFFEANGIREDPATGSANTCLGAYLRDHRVLGNGNVDVRVEQGAAVGRPSLLYVRAPADADAVRVGGRVVTAVRGELVGGSQ